jgi:hypothetical protein
MKHFKYFLTALLFAATLASCSDSDPNVDPDPGTGTGTGTDTVEPLPADLGDMLNHFQDKFGLTVKYEFAASEWEPVSIGKVYPYTAVTDTAKVKILLNYLNDQVFSLFPNGVIARYMPPKILLVDSLYNTFVYNDKITPERLETRYTLPGNVTGDYLVIGNVGARLNTSAADFKYNMISLIVDRLLFNQSLPELIEIKNITENAAAAVGRAIYLASGSVHNLNYPYWDGRAGAVDTWTLGASEPPADIYKIERTHWLGLGILNMGRPGYRGYTDEEIWGLRQISFAYSRGTIRQDFADFVAFILTKTPAERETFLATVAANRNCDPLDNGGSDTRFPHGGEVGAQAMRDKITAVRAYFKNNLGFDLPE